MPTLLITDKIAQLESLRSKTAELELSIEQEREEALASLPEQYGFGSVAEFIKAVKLAMNSSTPRRGVVRGAKVKEDGKDKGKGKGKKGRAMRAHITDETRTKLRAMVEAGKTGGEIARELGISTASVQNVKKALGLVKAR